MLKTSRDISEEISKGAVNAFLGEGVLFDGNLVFDGIVRIDGTFRGTIKSNDTLIIADTGKVEATIEVATAKISGTFEGDLYASKKIELYSSANVSGTLRADILKVEEGVTLNGNIQMGKGSLVVDGSKSGLGSANTDTGTGSHSVTGNNQSKNGVLRTAKSKKR